MQFNEQQLVSGTSRHLTYWWRKYEVETNRTGRLCFNKYYYFSTFKCIK